MEYQLLKEFKNLLISDDISMKSLWSSYISDKTKEVVLAQVYSRKQNYAASSLHLDTLNSEIKIVENMVDSVASEILIGLNSIYQEK